MKLPLILLFHDIILAFANGQRETLEKKPNIVLILADDVGTGDLPFFWSDDESKSNVNMPHLKKLASKGVTFQDAHSSPKCGPSRYSLLSGNYAHRGTRKYGTYNFDQESSQFRKYQVSIAEALRRNAKYKTWAAGKWHLGAYIQPHGLISNATDPNEKRSRMISEPGHNWSLPILFGPKYLGFDHSFISMGGVGGPPYSFFRDGMLKMDPKDYYFWPEGEYECDYGTCAIDKTHSGEGDPNWASAAHDMIIVNETEKFIDNHLQTSPNENFFAYIALGSVHTPHTPPEFWLDGTPVAGQYDTPHLDMLGQMDKAVGSIVKIIEDRNLQEDTVIIFTSDNGGLRDSRPDHISSGPLKGAKKEIWEGGHRVPLIIRFDGKVPMNERRNKMVGINDIYETICDIVGIDKPGGAAVDSRSFASYLFNEKKQTDLRKYLSHFRMDFEVQHAIRWWNMKLIHVPKNNTFSLYNLNKDIGESNNLIKKPWVKKNKRIQSMYNKLLSDGPCARDDKTSSFHISRLNKYKQCNWFKKQHTEKRCEKFIEGEINCPSICSRYLKQRNCRDLNRLFEQNQQLINNL